MSSRDRFDRPEPVEVVRLVNDYVDTCYRQAQDASNVDLLDGGQVYSLHLTAAEVYGIGYAAGQASESERQRGEYRREFDTRRRQAMAADRIDLARKALVATGYFEDAEVSDDVAPRFTEVWANVVEPLLSVVAVLDERLAVLDAITDAVTAVGASDDVERLILGHIEKAVAQRARTGAGEG